MTAEEDPSDLFDEFLEQHGACEAVDVPDLLRRAGSRAEGLKRRIDILLDVERLAEDPPTAETTDDRGGVLGPFELRGLLGTGGLSRVYLGFDVNLLREVAIKVLSPEISRQEARVWITAEGQSLAMLEHESIVRIYEIGDDRDGTYIAMERIRGPSLRKILDALSPARDSSRSLPPSLGAHVRSLSSLPARCKLIARLARALDYCHAKGIVHRDIKPNNILIAPDGTPKLIDFGLAHLRMHAGRRSITRGLFGTAAYLAPEQVTSAQSGASPASDQFSLGVVLYELLTLRHPFSGRGQGGATTLDAIAEAAPPLPKSVAPSIPTDLERVVLQCLERNPNRRYGSLAELADDLEAFLEHRAVQARSQSIRRSLARRWRRNRGAILAFAVAATLSLLSAAAYWGATIRSHHQGVTRALGSIEDRLATATEAEDFEAVFSGLVGLAERARELDATGVQPWLMGPYSPDVERTWEAASERLTDTVEPLYDRINWTYGLAERDARYVDLLVAWRAVFYLQHATAPRVTSSFGSSLGAVTPTGAGVLLRYEGDVFFPTFAPRRDMDILPSGLYRYRNEVDGEVHERDFYASPHAPAREVDAKRAAPWLLARMATTEELTVSVARGISGAAEDARKVSLPSLDVLVQPVTWEDARRVFSTQELAPVVEQLKAVFEARPSLAPAGAFEGSSLAPLPWSYAFEFAARTGTRLPTPVEIWGAFQQGLIEREPYGYREEWTLSYLRDAPHERATFLHKHLEPAAPGTPISSSPPWLKPVPHERAVVPTTCFRVVRSR